MIRVTRYNTRRCKRTAEAFHEEIPAITLGVFFSQNGKIVAFLADVWYGEP
jgi:hypothetical protein